MEQAGLAAWQWLQQQPLASGPILIFCGAGNNGGDGLVLARLARAAGYWVEVRICGDWAKLPAAATAAKLRFEAEGGQLALWSEPWPLVAPSLIVDALLGIGSRGELRFPYAQVVQAINASLAPVMALDLPTGLNANTGDGRLVVKADHCLSFLGWKPGLFTGRAAEFTGQLALAELEIAQSIRIQVNADLHKVELADFKSLLLPRSREAHKGKFGQVLVIGGQAGMGGAAIMAAEAALRVGAGRVSLATAPVNIAAALSRSPELMVEGLELDSVERLQALLQRASVLVLGPGLGQSEWSKALFAQAWFSSLPLVLDADGLNLLSRISAAERSAPLILTPHPGEAARLLGISSYEVNRDRLAAAQALADKYQAQVILKGAGTLLALPDGPLKLAAVGNPGMATAGMGDILSGIVGGLWAQSVPWPQLTALATCLHGAAADCAAEMGERGLRASALLDWLSLLVNPLQLERAPH